VREMHWHKASEWAYMLNGKARITAMDGSGRHFIDDVSAGDLWFFPPVFRTPFKASVQTAANFSWSLTMATLTKTTRS
jgi:uncharacterized cupin superfamily protein